MKNATRLALAIVFLVGFSQPVFAQRAGKEWEVLNQEVIKLYREGNYKKATLVAEQALKVAEENVGPDHPDVAASLNNLAGLYAAQGKYAQAETVYKRSLAIDEKAHGPDHTSVATSLNNLASLYKIQGKFAQAEPLFKRSLAIWEKNLGPNHRNVAVLVQRDVEFW